MAEDPGNDDGQIRGQEGVSHYLDQFEKSPSEHAKTVFVQEKLVPWIKNKGMNHSWRAAQKAIVQLVHLNG
jgi:hypothetical protein